MNDVFNNFVADPAKGVAIESLTDGSAVEGLSEAYEGASEQVTAVLAEDGGGLGSGLESIVEAYDGASEESAGVLGALAEAGRFVFESFFAEE